MTASKRKKKTPGRMRPGVFRAANNMNNNSNGDVNSTKRLKQLNLRSRLESLEQVLTLLSREALIVYFCASDLAIGKPLTDDARERLIKALGRVRGVCQELQR